MKSMLATAAALVLVFSGPAWTAEGPGPESAEDTILRLEAEVRMLRATVAEIVKENAALKAENAALRSGDAAEVDPAPGPDTKDAPAEPQKIITFHVPGDFVVGAAGRFHLAVRIEQVLGPSEAICSMPVYKDAPGPPILLDRWRFLVREFSTEGLVDRMNRNMKDAVFIVQGTRTLDLVDGGTETVFVLAPAERTEKGKGP